MAADPVVSPADTRDAATSLGEAQRLGNETGGSVDASPANTIRRLTEWSNDAPHDAQSVRFVHPTYANPGELRRDVRALLAVGERDKAEIAELRLMLADAEADVDAGERDRRQIARLTEALREARPIVASIVAEFDAPSDAAVLAQVDAVLAGEEDATNG